VSSIGFAAVGWNVGESFPNASLESELDVAKGDVQ